MTFDEAFDRLMTHEGGYSNNPADPGGATNYGITQAVARANGYTGDMREFTKDAAKRIYKQSYWDAVQADQLPAGINYAVFDAAVNSGVRQSIKWLQRAAGVTEDGIVGAQTIGAARAANPDALLRKMLGFRLGMMTGLQAWGTFGKGWALRIAKELAA